MVQVFFAMNIRRYQTKFAGLVRDLTRVVNPVYLMGHVGQRMYRAAVRRTGLVGLAALAVSVVGRGVGFLPEFTIKRAAVFTLVFGFVTLFSGLGMRLISNMLMSERINIAQANNLNLLEDKKKSRLDYYLRRLYDSVFRYEAAVRYSREEVREEEEEVRRNVKGIAGKLMAHLSEENLQFLGVSDLSDMVDHMNTCNPLRPRELEKSWEGFRITARYALTHPLPATLEAELIGFDLTMVEDWLDGAFFDANDVKLVEQYRANSTLAMIKRRSGCRLPDRLSRKRHMLAHSFWFHNTFRTLAVGVGTQIKRMNKRVRQGYFKAEHFLWIHPELDSSVQRRFGREVLEDLIDRRKRLIWKIFSHRYEAAVELLWRIYRPKLKLAADLRRRFDLEYFLGELPAESYLGDLERLGFSQARLHRERARVENGRARDDELRSWLEGRGPSSSGRTPLDLRSLRIARHINLFGLREAVGGRDSSMGRKGARQDSHERQDRTEQVLSQVLGESEQLSHSLVTVRTFWLLNWLEFEEYCAHLKEIAYSSKDGNHGLQTKQEA